VQLNFLGVISFVGLGENLVLVWSIFIEVKVVLDAEFACLVVANGVVALGMAVYFLQEVFGFGGGEVAVVWL
jgi:hypothetical protein